ncbi:MAG TPA: glycosyltransferase [bacterium]|nr:glycosyltransferase [bacterium]HPT29585.1 glycosyltransferase [bacterium]
MRILEVNKFHYLRGGAEKYFLDITEYLKKQGHQVAVFSMQHPKNLPSPQEKYFVSRISFNEGGLRDKLIAPGRIIYSREAKQKFEKLVKDFQPEIIHIHNIYHQISPSILDVAKKYNIPVVMHLHDYKLICPNYQLFTHNEICYRCRGGKYYNAVTHCCFKNSLAMSSLVMTEMYLHHKIWQIYEKNIAAYIAPSRFMKDTCVSFGVPAEKIKLLYNFIDTPIAKELPELGENYLLYFGRLSPEKGIDVLLRSLVHTKTDLPLRIAGSGPAEANLKKLTEELGLSSRVKFLGNLSQKDLKPLIARAKAIVIPSLWLENMPFSLLESLALGKVVIASQTGGLGELIKPGISGFLFTRGDSLDLAAKIDSLDKIKLDFMGQKAKQLVFDLTLPHHYRGLLEIFKEVCAKKS